MLRKSKGLIQNELGERIGVTFQAVSKWERGETLPDTAILPDLAKILETTIDNILLGREKVIEHKEKCTVSKIKNGIHCLKKPGEHFGKDNLICRGTIDGINTNLNIDIEPAYFDDYIFKAFLAEAVISNLTSGMYIAVSDVKNNLRNEHFKKIVISYCNKHRIK